ncbi:hypothetical protein SISSUDRAFT_1063137 [Sistotremastrum suecicum HHB10207 ss-3]|uniref:Low temperature requirement A n=1 Tax=Sistotremastrum suecicum HHB10207 ss-3 TaxID=1314776 RepID=A0A166C3T7_9AGAM|nr:hypothetical protein SISSUDRAFT_1063137 [Sistotremastrum suecicum HHB10207 ss-3]
MPNFAKLRGWKIPRKNYSDVLTAPSEIPGLDLMLAISMTTAFASLTDNTDVLTGDAAVSYICFFALVWWIWASQVLYNARFRHRDILHCIYAFLTFVVYGGLAAFTGDFDLTDGLSSSDPDGDQATAIEENLGFLDDGTNQAEQARSTRLPSLNARGICMVMGFSRVLLLFQYFLLLCRAPRNRRAPLWWHCGGLLASTALFFATYGVLRHSNSATANITKIVFWYTALFIEGATHYMANEHHEDEAIPYLSAPLSKRMSELFIIILGAGLDQITKSFHSEVGTLGFGAHTVGIMIFSGIIVVGEFALWFINKPKSVNVEELEKEREKARQTELEKEDEITAHSEIGTQPGSPLGPGSPISLQRPISEFIGSDAGRSEVSKSSKSKKMKIKKKKEDRRLKKEDDEPSDRRLLTWFFFNFVFLACIILTLQAVARLVAFDNLQAALTKLLALMEGILHNFPPFDATQFPAAEKGFTDLGVSFTDFIDALNLYAGNAEAGNLTAAGGLAATVAVPIIILFDTFDALPDDGSLLSADLDELLSGLITDQTQAAQILANVEASRIHSAFWFFGVAGGTLMALAVMNAIRHKYTDIWLWISIAVRFICGLGFALVSFVDIGKGFFVNDLFVTLPGIAPVWNFARTSWILGSFAFLILGLTAFDASLQYWATSRYSDDPDDIIDKSA